MIACEKCGRVIQAYEVKYRLEVDGRRRTLCNEDAKELLKQLEARQGPPKPAAKPAPPQPAAAPGGAPAAPAAKPALSPEELEARKKATLEKAAAAKAAKAAEQQP